MNVLKSYFVFGGKRSLDFGLVIDTPQIAQKPKPRTTRIAIPGSKRDFTYVEEGFDNIEVSYQTWCLEKEKDLILSRAGEVAQWLMGDEYLVLSDTYDPDHFRLGFCCESLDPEIIARTGSQQRIVFSCDPFSYSWAGHEKIEISAQEGDITGTRQIRLINTGWKSYPQIYIRGNGKIVLQVYYGNIKAWEGSFTFAGSLLIDADSMETYVNGNSANHLKVGDGYPALESGECTVKILRENTSDEIESASIKPRWRVL